MMKDDVLKELDMVMNENTIAFFSVVLTQRKEGDILPTLTAFGIDKATYETRLRVSDAIIDLAQSMRQRE